MKKIDFIANGDMATVQRAGRRVELYGHHFVNATLKIDGYEEEVTAWVMLEYPDVRLSGDDSMNKTV